jgi:hypothetical protein
VRQAVLIAVDALSLTMVLTLLTVFPFNFNVIPNHAVADATRVGVTAVLALVSVGILIGLVVRLVRFITNLARGVTLYQEGK